MNDVELVSNPDTGYELGDIFQVNNRFYILAIVDMDLYNLICLNIGTRYFSTTSLVNLRNSIAKDKYLKFVGRNLFIQIKNPELFG